LGPFFCSRWDPSTGRATFPPPAHLSLWFFFSFCHFLSEPYFNYPFSFGPLLPGLKECCSYNRFTPFLFPLRTMCPCFFPSNVPSTCLLRLTIAWDRWLLLHFFCQWGCVSLFPRLRSFRFYSSPIQLVPLCVRARVNYLVFYPPVPLDVGVLSSFSLFFFFPCCFLIANFFSPTFRFSGSPPHPVPRFFHKLLAFSILSSPLNRDTRWLFTRPHFPHVSPPFFFFLSQSLSP